MGKFRLGGGSPSCALPAKAGLASGTTVDFVEKGDRIVITAKQADLIKAL